MAGGIQAPPRSRSRAFAHEPEHRRHYLTERNTGVDFVSGAVSQHQLDGLQKTQHASDLLGTFSIWVVRPGGQPINNHVGRCGQQDDVVELWVKAYTIRPSSPYAGRMAPPDR